MRRTWRRLIPTARSMPSSRARRVGLLIEAPGATRTPRWPSECSLCPARPQLSGEAPGTEPAKPEREQWDHEQGEERAVEQRTPEAVGRGMLDLRLNFALETDQLASSRSGRLSFDSCEGWSDL